VREEFPATGERGGEVVVVEGGHAAQFRATAPSVHTLSEMSANGLVLREMRSSTSSPKVQFGQEIVQNGQDFGPYPNFGLGEGPVGRKFCRFQT
jgi:hypothetical protein